jgi:hypothetical protein
MLYAGSSGKGRMRLEVLAKSDTYKEMLVFGLKERRGNQFYRTFKAKKKSTVQSERFSYGVSRSSAAPNNIIGPQAPPKSLALTETTYRYHRYFQIL